MKLFPNFEGRLPGDLDFFVFGIPYVKGRNNRSGDEDLGFQSGELFSVTIESTFEILRSSF